MKGIHKSSTSKVTHFSFQIQKYIIIRNDLDGELYTKDFPRVKLQIETC